MIGAKLQEIANISEKLPETKSESKIISIVSTSNESIKLMGPLKSSRAGNSIQNSTTVTSNDKTGSSRLLNTALQSTRNVIDNKSKHKEVITNDNKLTTQLSTSRDISNKNVNIRNVLLQGQKREHQEVTFDVPGKKKMKLNRNLKTTDNSQAVAIGSVEYFEKMNQVAQQSGFKNAQEMIASQKEMMALLQPQQQAIIPSVIVPSANTAAFPPKVPYHQYNAYIERGGRGRGRWVEGRVGRGGRGGRFSTVDTTASAATTESNPIESQTTSIPASSADNTTEATAIPLPTPYPVVFRGGRGGRTSNYWQERGGRVFSGRSSGRFGGRAPMVGNKTWVRPTDLETPLANNR